VDFLRRNVAPCLESCLEQKHILLSSLGTQNLKTERRQSQYELNDRQTEPHYFSAFGLNALLPDPSDEIWFMLTPEAKRTQKVKIKEEAKRLGLVINIIELSDEIDDTRLFLETIARKIPKGCSLTLDVTQGLRHHAFLTYSLALYLTTFREVSIKGAWYCNIFAGEKEAPKPFVDLKPSLDLADWFHAISNFQNHGITTEMVNLMRAQIDSQRALATTPQMQKEITPLDQFTKALEQVGFNYNSGLVLELGKPSLYLAENISNFKGSSLTDRLPLLDEFAEIVNAHSKKTAFNERPKNKGKWKKGIALNVDELDRQKNLIDTYLERQQYPLAFGLMREWIISWFMFREKVIENWLDYSKRKPFEAKLGGLLALNKNEKFRSHLNEEDRNFASFWQTLSQELRNSFHHHGMREEEVSIESIDPVVNFWNQLKEIHTIDPPRVGGGKRRLLICPHGGSPGATFSALHHIKPDRLIIIASEQTISSIGEALEKSRQDIGADHILLLKNPHSGIAEFPGHIDTVLKAIFDADEVYVNLTGGTSLMGILAQQLAGKSERELQRPTRKFILIDKRPYEEQQNNPWVVGDIHYLGEDAQKENSKPGDENEK